MKSEHIDDAIENNIIQLAKPKQTGFSSEINYSPYQDLLFTGKLTPNIEGGQMDPSLGLGVNYKGFNSRFKYRYTRFRSYKFRL